MRKLAIGAVLFLLAATMSIAQTPSSDQQSATDKAKGAASSTADTIKHGAETGASKTKEGAEKAYDATKNAVTGSSDQSGQTSEQSAQPSGQAQAGAGATSTAGGHLPQTASPLPLLGLLGMGAFSLGAWKSRWFHKN